jgi:CO dehydrogenase maturation factor
MAVDADPDGNLAQALGVPREMTERVVPIVELKELIGERTGVQPGTIGGFFRLNPQVDDIPDRFSLQWEGVRLLVMGTIRGPLAGCVCPESTMLKALLGHLVLERDEVVILDMDAGVEHLGRGTAQGVDAFLVVAEPGQRSFQTAHTVRDFAKGLGVGHCYVVGFKTRDEAERQFIRKGLAGLTILGFVDYDPDLVRADMGGLNVYRAAPRAAEQARQIRTTLEEHLKSATRPRT